MNFRIRSRHSALAATFIMALLVVLTPVGLRAQIDTGGVTGTVFDPSGAVVPGARITLTNVATDAKTVTDSTATGTYDFSGVLPGSYRIEAEAKGFSNYQVRGLDIHVQQVLTQDVHLTAGNVQQQVTV
ncbi:MAG: carboxypeptidase-like regulatory domain-containing protein, partial [Acidobacteriaceae bacterium]